ncbi:dephospho-CoA kinase [Aeromicrobium sp. IC_218]|uniref:dephospho-CoA kinase n=1 Tax=Aeromicrobium sp. IC_218 TaxID=2545468 RepID=UPI00103BFC5D|nr:dephospho-CoA kinase [Aeromicrobium sp. IC_218]TCJ00152.1 dephospho-CoA kinase [Aeromicrobium sp. IC_218]
MRLGLTGGIGSGKSTASTRLRELGATVLDYDQLARDVVEPGSAGLAAIADRFGAEILRADGTLDRPALGAIVFADPAALKDLEGITHPAIRERAALLEREAGPDAVVVHDNALLVDMGAHRAMDTVVVVDVPVETQVQRLVERRGLTEADARARIGAQLSREERLAAADHVLDNSGTPDDLRAAVDALWETLARS